MNHSPQISIIIPVFNTEAGALERCLHSVRAQTYTDFEAILVDDGSTNGSEATCDWWAKVDPRFISLHQRNQGVSAARNHGIEAAKGEFITFVDSDDCIANHYLELLMNNSNSIDLAVTGIKIIDMYNGTERLRQNHETIYSKICDESMTYAIKSRMINTACAKRFKTGIIRKERIRFDENCNLGEDTLFVISYMSRSRDIICLKEAPYLYYLDNSANLSKFDEGYVSKLVKATKKMEEILKGKFPLSINSKEWRERKSAIYTNAIFAILRDSTHTCHRKKELMKTVFNAEGYLDGIKDAPETKWRFILKQRSPFAAMLFWRFIQIKKHIFN